MMSLRKYFLTACMLFRYVHSLSGLNVCCSLKDINIIYHSFVTNYMSLVQVALILMLFSKTRCKVLLFPFVIVFLVKR